MMGGAGALGALGGMMTPNYKAIGQTYQNQMNQLAQGYLQSSGASK